MESPSLEMILKSCVAVVMGCLPLVPGGNLMSAMSLLPSAAVICVPVVLGLQPGPHHDPFSFAFLSVFELTCCGTTPEMGSVAFHSLDETQLPTAVSCAFHNKLGLALLGLEAQPSSWSETN